MATCYLLATTSVVALLLALDAANTTVLIVYFTVVSGGALGLMSPLSGLFQAEVYGEERLGTLSGVNVIVVSVAGAAGSWLGGVSLDATGSFHLLLAGAMVFQLAAVAAIRWQATASTPVPKDDELEDRAGDYDLTGRRSATTVNRSMRWRISRNVASKAASFSTSLPSTAAGSVKLQWMRSGSPGNTGHCSAAWSHTVIT